MGPGAPSKWEDVEKRQRFLTAKALGASDAKACAAAGFSYESLYNWRAWAMGGKGNKMGDTPCPEELVEFITVEIPAAERKLYEKALKAIARGLENEDPDKAANVGLKVMDKFFGPDLNPVSTKHEHELTAGESPIEFKVVFDLPKALPAPIDAEQVRPSLPEGEQKP